MGIDINKIHLRYLGDYVWIYIGASHQVYLHKIHKYEICYQHVRSQQNLACVFVYYTDTMLYKKSKL